MQTLSNGTVALCLGRYKLVGLNNPHKVARLHAEVLVHICKHIEAVVVLSKEECSIRAVVQSSELQTG